MDKRVEKTKKLLKCGLFEMLNKKPLHKITVTEICECAKTSRITFYNYYEDKYDLIDDIATDIKAEVRNCFLALQEENNPSDDLIKRHLNIADALFATEDSYFERFQHEIHTETPEMQFFYIQYIKQAIESFELQTGKIHPNYPVKQLSSFLVNGLWAYIGEAEKNRCPKQKTRQEIKGLMTAILQSEVFNE